MKTKIAIVGIFWDGYYDLWEDFLELKEKFWKNSPYPTYIVNQIKDLSYIKKYDVNVIHAGEDAEYSRKVQTALEKIDADYYVLLLDDFFFGNEINGGILDDRISFMKSNNICYYGMPLPEFRSTIKGSSFKGNKHILNIESTAEYTVCCQPAIWEKEFLKKCIGDGNYNAWVFEAIYIYSKDAHTSTFLSKCKNDLSNPLCLRHGALQGKMVPNTISFFKNMGYCMKNKREILGRYPYFVHNVKATLKEIMPFSLQRLMKKFVNTNSVADRYMDSVVCEMNKMGIK